MVAVADIVRVSVQILGLVVHERAYLYPQFDFQGRGGALYVGMARKERISVRPPANTLGVQDLSPCLRSIILARSEDLPGCPAAADLKRDVCTDETEIKLSRRREATLGCSYY